MGRYIGYASAVACAIGLAVAPAGAKHAPAPAPAKHNFIGFDLQAATPKPLENWTRNPSVELLDAASAARHGDDVTFDVLVIAQNFQQRERATGKLFYRTWLATRIEHYRASCGWRAIQATGFDAQGDWTNLLSPPPRMIRLMEMYAQEHAVVDAVCAGGPLGTAHGAPSVAAAVAAWRSMFPRPGNSAIVAVMAWTPPPIAPWMDGGAPHQFTLVTTDAASGRRVYVDKANLLPDGAGKTGLSFVLLGPDEQHDAENATAYTFAAERQVHYDCTARTMTIVAQGMWNAEREFLSVETHAYAPRAATESAAAGAEIAAACDGLPDGGATFRSVFDAWADARKGLPAH